MKKYILGGAIAAIIVAAVITAIAGTGLNSNEQAGNDTTLANIEALAAELPEVTVTCGKTEGKCYKKKSFSLCMKGEYMGPDCAFSGYMSDSCYPCQGR